MTKLIYIIRYNKKYITSTMGNTNNSESSSSGPKLPFQSRDDDYGPLGDQD
jgi:hypothetical protein